MNATHSRKRPGLTQEQKQEIVSRYEAGEVPREIARVYPMSETTIYRLLRQAGAVREQARAALRAHGSNEDVLSISADRWREIYSAPGSGYPSMKALGERFGVSGACVSQHLRKMGLTPRSPGEQFSLEVKLGRVVISGAGNRAVQIEAMKCYWRSLTPEQRRKHAAHAAKGRKVREQRAAEARVAVPCSWCGTVLSRKPSHYRRSESHFCDAQHYRAGRQHCQNLGESSPRLLIVEKLIELNRGWPNTYERLEKVGRQIGAREPEILEVLTRDPGEVP